MQTFREIREEHCYYVDKTAFIGRLLDEGKHYFLSRPRRFGKSLFLDTCKELFEGSEALFEGLAIHDEWDWSVRHPILRLSFGSGNFKQPDHLALNVMEQLAAAERRAGLATEYRTAPGISPSRRRSRGRRFLLVGAPGGSGAILPAPRVPPATGRFGGRSFASRTHL